MADSTTFYDLALPPRTAVVCEERCGRRHFTLHVSDDGLPRDAAAWKRETRQVSIWATAPTVTRVYRALSRHRTPIPPRVIDAWAARHGVDANSARGIGIPPPRSLTDGELRDAIAVLTRELESRS